MSAGVEGPFVWAYTTYVYFMQSVSRRVLYLGICRDLLRRVWQHKTHARNGFSDDYNATRLVYFEEFVLAENAIAREKQIKRWRREKKERLIAGKNPHWMDLAEDWFRPEHIEAGNKSEQRVPRLRGQSRFARDDTLIYKAELGHASDDDRRLDA